MIKEQSNEELENILTIEIFINFIQFSNIFMRITARMMYLE